MSYILDALKKADAQRERDPARGIHAQPAPLPTLQQPGIGQRPGFWAAAAAGIAVLAVAGWFYSQEAAQVQRAPVATSDVASPRSSGVPAAAPAPLGTAAAPAPEPVADAVLPPPAPVVPAPVAAAPPRAATPPTENAARAVPEAKAPPAPGAPASAAAAAAPPPAPPAAVAAAPVPPPAAARPAAPPPAAPVAAGEAPIGNGLPADAPRLAISGGVYSANRAQRMLIVNGQVVNEGADLGGGIVLEEIRPKAAVLRFRGGRYNVGF